MCSLTTFLQGSFCSDDGFEQWCHTTARIRTSSEQKYSWRKVVNEHMCWLRFGQKGQSLSGQDRGLNPHESVAQDLRIVSAAINSPCSVHIIRRSTPLPWLDLSRHNDQQRRRDAEAPKAGLHVHVLRTDAVQQQRPGLEGQLRPLPEIVVVLEPALSNSTTTTDTTTVSPRKLRTRQCLLTECLEICSALSMLKQ